jgi:hypothetical protein
MAAVGRFLNEQCIKHNVNCPEPKTIARLLDKLVGHARPLCARILAHAGVCARTHAHTPTLTQER